MGTLTEFALLVAGLAGLWFGTELTIRGAVTLANRLGISEFIIGVAVLSVGSDLPELAISVDGALKAFAGGDASDVIVGTALGSYLGQLGFVLGFVALFQQLGLSHGTILRHGAALVGSLLLLALFGWDGVVTRIEGTLLVAAYVGYFAALFLGSGSFTTEESEQPSTGLGLAWVLLAVGLVIVVVGAEMTVSSAIRLAVSMDVSEAFVSIVLIGMGTSLPELSISLGAALKNRHSMSVGNLIGSNVFDTLVPVGIAAAIATLGFNPDMLAVEIPYLVLLTIVVMFFFWRIPGIQRHEAVIILLMYFGYVGWKFQVSLG
jgi:cation:H+ antiporter